MRDQPLHKCFYVSYWGVVAQSAYKIASTFEFPFEMKWLKIQFWIFDGPIQQIKRLLHFMNENKCMYVQARFKSSWLWNDKAFSWKPGTLLFIIILQSPFIPWSEKSCQQTFAKFLCCPENASTRLPCWKRPIPLLQLTSLKSLRLRKLLDWSCLSLLSLTGPFWVLLALLGPYWALHCLALALLGLT